VRRQRKEENERIPQTGNETLDYGRSQAAKMVGTYDLE
jgi:hypothetical protein